MNYLAIDPGPVDSAYVLITGECQALDFGKINNLALRDVLPGLSRRASYAAIEMVASYGMAVGAEVFETCVWTGRFIERSSCRLRPVFRRDVKLHHCQSPRANDANITQALIDRFAPNTPNRGKGSKAEPGWFYGFKADLWQAYALAVYLADTTT